MRGVPLGVVLALAYGASAAQTEIADPSAPRTLVVAVEVDRDSARLIGFTIKARPFVARRESSQPELDPQGNKVQIEAALLGPGGARYTQRIAVAGLCLAHGPDTPPEIAGDTIRLHRESFLVEAPEIPGFDRIEIASSARQGIAGAGKALGVVTLDAAHYMRAGGTIRYEDLAFSQASERPDSLLTSGAVHFPEEFGDPDIFTMYGNPAETGKRINVVLVPDGYTYAEKASMQAHAQALVDAFRARTPYKEHDPFINYILVYAYSNQDGTDQCDCSVVRDTAMATRFAGAPNTCLNPENRCLYYGGACDTDSSQHIATTELRAPARDVTIVMVNTTRYGGCGGERAVYSAANVDGTEVALHELGHTLAGLADEYGGDPACGSGSGINVSMNPVNGNWTEWIADLGAPWEGAQYYNQCIYRPAEDCQMNHLHREFCPVCRQQFALSFFAHSRVSPTAPIETASPASPLDTDTVSSETFSVVTRLASGPGVDNDVVWELQGPGYPTPTTVASGTTSYSRTFPQPGTYTLTSRVVADKNFIKPVKYGANVDVASWTVQVCHLVGEPSASNDGPICASTTLHLSVTSIAGAAYSWTGPGGFQSSAQNPAIGNASASASGTYFVTVTTPGCEFTLTTAASVIAEGATCEDGNSCTTGDICSAGSCRPGTATLNCDDGSACTIDSCDLATGCAHTNITGACDDGSACTTGDTCVGGLCHGASVSCDDGNACTTNGCDPATGACIFTNSTASCNDGNACTTGDVCANGSCQTGTGTLTCNDGFPCTSDSCDPASGCRFAPNDAVCADTNPCTTDSCSPATGCVNAPRVCTASDACHQAGVCAPATGICSNPLRDTDQDGHIPIGCGGDDCNDNAANVWYAPINVTNLRLTGRTPTSLVWDDQRAAVGPGTTYHVASGLRQSSGSFSYAASCLTTTGGTPLVDPRPNPSAGTGYWYLIRAVNACGTGTWGNSLADFGILACGGPP